MKISLTSATSGLRAHQTKMDVISNNVANVNTNGFKSSSVKFSDLYYQNIGKSKNGNPMQVGSGVSVSDVKVNSSLSGIINSDHHEMSDVDLAKEFTDMITTQRGFQANTINIIVTDEILDELNNIKR
jgi:flagellar basal-body rod protein FlgB